ncbi:MAG: site-2 protease family protein [Magnetococcales bacterium]|nr:site-2 protease family protein [Magnetococcales bacterium]
MNETVYSILVWAPGVIFAITLHEWAHGFVAFLHGDDTAARLGRLTLNPLPHIDPVMTLLVPGLILATSLATLGTPFIFGSAKPVPINPNNFRYKRGGVRKGGAQRMAMFWVAAAGPFVNFLLALACAGVLRVTLAMTAAPPMFLVGMLLAAIKMNVILGVFNLFPVPPLDGGRMMTALLPPPLDRTLAALERAGLGLVLLLAFSGVLSPILSGAIRFFVGMAVSL